MELVAAFPVRHRSLDHIIIWDDGARLVAYGYQQGRVMRTTALEARAVAQAKSEAANAFGVEDPTRARWVQSSAARW